MTTLPKLARHDWVAAQLANKADAEGVGNYMRPTTRPIPRLSRMIATWQAGGSSWFRGGTSVSINAADTDTLVGQHVSIVTANGAPGPSTWSRYNLPAVNLATHNLVVLIKTDNMSTLGGITLRVSNGTTLSTTDWAELRVSAGNVENSILNGGEWVPVTFSWANAAVTGSPDKTAITSFQFRFNGYDSQPATVRFAWFGATLARGPYCILSFDDGLAAANPAITPMARYGFPGTMYLIADGIGTPGFQTWDDVRRMQGVHGWDTACHAYRLENHNLPQGLKSLTLDALDAELRQLKEWALENSLNAPDHFAWPKGQFNGEMLDVASRYFSTAAMVTSYTAQAWPTFTPMRLARFGVAATTTPAQIGAACTEAIATGTSVQFMFHQIVPSGAVGLTKYNAADFDAALASIAATGIPVGTIRDAYLG